MNRLVFKDSLGILSIAVWDYLMVLIIGSVSLIPDVVSLMFYHGVS